MRDTKHDSALAEIRSLGPIECGTEAAKHFMFDEGYRNLNHGSYGACPNEVRSVYRYFQDRTEARPDAFVRYEYRTHLLDEARSVIAKYLNAPVRDTVLVPNSSTAFDTILRNLVFEPGDVIICFTLVYAPFQTTLQYLSETTPVQIHKIDYEYPASDDHVCNAFESAVVRLRKKGKRPKVAVFDTVSSLPAVRMPFERLVTLCKSLSILSCLDGAHGIGLFPINIEKLDPDFFMSNCHKWLHVPRPCAVMCVPVRNQHLMRASLPTSIGYVPEGSPEKIGQDRSLYETNFGYVGTLDDNAYLCLEAALLWRTKLTWNGETGEEAIMAYVCNLARKGGKIVADILQTEVLDNEERTLSDNAFANVRLPVMWQQERKMLEKGDASGCQLITSSIMESMIVGREAAVCVTFHAMAFWVRLSAQVYLTMEDFEYAGRALKEVCGQKPWKQK